MAVPELRQLRTFLAVAEELNFTRAAERLHLGQQAVSKAVRQLERELGVGLLERSPHRVRLTAAGQALLATGPSVLATADAAFEQACEAGRGLTGTVHIGVTPAIGPAEREQVARLLRGEDDVSVSLLDVRPDSIRALLRSRELDLVLARTCSATDGIESAALCPTEAILHAPEGHPLAAAESVRLAQLDGYRVLTWNPPGTAFTDLLPEPARSRRSDRRPRPGLCDRRHPSGPCVHRRRRAAAHRLAAS